MKLENQVCTLEQAKRLSQLNVKPSDNTPYWWWWKEQNKEWTLEWYGSHGVGSFDDAYPAWSVAELGVMLPTESGLLCWDVHYSDHHGVWHCTIRDLVKWEMSPDSFPPIAYESEENTMAEVLADALIHCLENKLTTPEQVNQNLQN